MNFLGKDAISSTTRTTGRTLLVLSATAIFAAIGWVDIAETSLLGLSVKQDAFLPLLQVLILASMVAHSVQWVADLKSYRGWNIEGRKAGMSRLSTGSKTQFDDLVRKLSGAEPSFIKTVPELKEELQRLNEQIGAFNKNLGSFDRYAKFYVYFWHLFVPIALGVTAVLMAHYG